jgi:hypothetical protein
MPNYLSLNSDILWTDIDGVSGSNIIHWSLELTSSGLSEVHETVDQDYPPGIKLFYSLSNSTTVIVPDMSINFIENRFDTYIKRENSNDGRPWNAESQLRAPGFYLFRPTLSSIDPVSIQRPQDDIMDPEYSRVVLGTFSFSPLENSEIAQRSFNSTPSMDIPLDWNSGTLEFSISLIGENLELNYGKKDNVLTEKYYLWDYIKSPLPLDGSINEYTRNLGSDSEDSDFWSYLGESENYLYLHIFSSLHGGAGFTNTYWSELQYLGYIPIQNSNLE